MLNYKVVGVNDQMQTIESNVSKRTLPIEIFDKDKFASFGVTPAKDQIGAP